MAVALFFLLLLLLLLFLVFLLSSTAVYNTYTFEIIFAHIFLLTLAMQQRVYSWALITQVTFLAFGVTSIFTRFIMPDLWQPFESLQPIPLLSTLKIYTFEISINRVVFFVFMIIYWPEIKSAGRPAIFGMGLGIGFESFRIIECGYFEFISDALGIDPMLQPVLRLGNLLHYSILLKIISDLTIKCINPHQSNIITHHLLMVAQNYGS